MIRFLLFLITILLVNAYPQDLSKLPNGNSYGLTLGHPGGATKKTTGIANALYSAGKKWATPVCKGDADGDGQSNGLEMGDPCCVWTVGAVPMFTTGLSDPNSATSTTLRVMPKC